MPLYDKLLDLKMKLIQGMSDKILMTEDEMQNTIDEGNSLDYYLDMPCFVHKRNDVYEEYVLFAYVHGIFHAECLYDERRIMIDPTSKSEAHLQRTDCLTLEVLAEFKDMKPYENR